jgi:putative PIN family toxin of toxin-antitoxin system
LRFVLDVDVLVSGLLSPRGAPALLLERWLDGEFELIVSKLLLEELERTFALPKLRKRIPAEAAAGFVALLREVAEVAADPTDPPATRSKDAGDDYLIALAAREQAHLVSGDAHVLALEPAIPVLLPRAALDLLV